VLGKGLQAQARRTLTPNPNPNPNPNPKVYKRKHEEWVSNPNAFVGHGIEHEVASAVGAAWADIGTMYLALNDLQAAVIAFRRAVWWDDRSAKGHAGLLNIIQSISGTQYRLDICAVVLRYTALAPPAQLVLMWRLLPDKAQERYYEVCKQQAPRKLAEAVGFPQLPPGPAGGEGGQGAIAAVHIAQLASMLAVVVAFVWWAVTFLQLKAHSHRKAHGITQGGGGRAGDGGGGKRGGKKHK
jgi:hypothetical protein